MFEVNVNGKQYRVAFKYFVDWSIDQRDMYYDIEAGRDVATLARYTRAQLYLMQDGEKIPVAYADTACSGTEQFSKDDGRKHSLTRLMDTDREIWFSTLTVDEQRKSLEYKRGLPSGNLRQVIDPNNIPDFDDKDVRTAFWQAYFGRQIDDRIRNAKPPNWDGVDWPLNSIERLNDAIIP